MYCGKCGKKVPNGCDYCMYCGTKVNLDEQNKTIVRSKVFNKKKLYILIAVFFLAFLSLIGGYFLFFNSPKIEGKYYSLYADKGYIEFSKDGTYKESMEDDDSAFNGTWTIESGYLILKDNLLGTEDKTTIYKNYIVYSKYIYKGNIPSGTKFDAICTYDNNNDQYIFNSDGTMKYINSGKVNNGIYSRNGEIITFHFNDDDQTYKLLIYGGGVDNSVYYKK
ncbi:MAG TPA: hypothetical protein DC024_10215 [Clostridiales bacterium]|jgi:hypothetical protein|nr:hypothetical protein [Clostridiales bacterium]